MLQDTARFRIFEHISRLWTPPVDQLLWCRSQPRTSRLVWATAITSRECNNAEIRLHVRLIAECESKLFGRWNRRIRSVWNILWWSIVLARLRGNSLVLLKFSYFFIFIERNWAKIYSFDGTRNFCRWRRSICKNCKNWAENSLIWMVAKF